MHGKMPDVKESAWSAIIIAKEESAPTPEK